MINNITIKNFTTHKNTKLEFCDGVNTIVGTSAAGKSSILKAIELVINNTAGTNYIRYNSDGITTVELNINDYKVVRVRSNKDNIYKLDDIVYKAFGTVPPKEIKEAINLSNLNIGHQLSSHFLLSLTPGEATKKLNEIVHLEDFDKYLSDINSKIRTTGEHISLNIQRDAELTDRLKEFNKTEEYISKLEQVSKISDSLGSISKKYYSLIVITQNIKECHKHALKSRYGHIIDNLYLSIKKNKQILTKYKEKYQNIKDIQTKIKYVQKINTCIIIDIEKANLKLKNIKLTKCPLCGAIKKELS